MTDDEYDEGVPVARVRVVRATDEALLVVEIDGDPFEGGEWWPKSQLHEESEVHADSDEGDEGELVVTTWLAEQRGLV